MHPDGKPSSTERALSSRTLEDLGLDLLARELTGGSLSRGAATKVLAQLPVDPETIVYRRKVLADIARSAELEEALDALLPKLRELTAFSRSAGESDAPLLQAVWRIGELELYVECIDDLCAAFDAAHRDDGAVLSDGFQALERYARHARAAEHFAALKEELPRLKEGLKRRQSVTIGINLDERFRPVEAALLSVNPERFRHSGILGRFLDSLESSPKYRVTAPLHSMPTPGNIPERKIPLTPLFRDLDDVLRPLGKSLHRGLREFLSVETAPLAGLERELSFYLGAHRLKSRLEGAGLPTCFPQIADTTERRLRASGFYNLQLALRALERGEAEKIVPNELHLGDDVGILVITGANQGGKTTFVQGAGILQVMAQAGLFVPARSATVSPVDAIMTHFPTGEAGNIETGRLSRELGELAGIFDEATDRSLLLLNESLSSTSAGEAVAVAEEMLAALRRVGTRTLYATHLHEISERLDEINAPADVGPQARRLTAETEWDGETVRRTYRIVPGSPQGKSFARDLARKHGISYSQLIERFRARGLL
ncbi:MAG: MutS-related protein [Spirochaetaceae bacterium]